MSNLYPNCPFYGFAMFRSMARDGYPFVLIATKGNQCGLMQDRHTPCYMEINSLFVEWKECPYIGEVRLEER